MASSNSPTPSPVNVTSYGPAGTPLDVRQSGQNILDNFCDGFPETTAHRIIPAYFGNNITELMEPKENLTRKQEAQVHGRTINQVGEGHEFVVFNIFVRLIRQTLASPTLLIMRTFEMDTKNRLNLKRNALASLLPNIKLNKVNTEAENDFLVLVKNVGVVFVEVKGSTTDSMIRSAEKQLANISGMIQCIMKAITNDVKRIIPTVKLIMVPDCMEETPKDPTGQGSYCVYKDVCDNFDKKWLGVLSGLHQMKKANPFSDEEFKELSQIIVGLWSAKAVGGTYTGFQACQLKQDEISISSVKQLEKIDQTVDTSNIRNEDQFKLREEKLNPLTKIVRTEESDIFRSCNSLKLCYLTPDQNELFRHQKQVIVRSSAGCGKSLLILFKVLEILKSPSDSSPILIVAPFPHNIRIINALLKNNIPVDKIENFPPPTTLSKVFVMDLEIFFKVKCSVLEGYDLAGYHIFIDDLQNLHLTDGSVLVAKRTIATFHDVGNFIDKTYYTCIQSDTYLWVMLDVVQGGMFADHGQYSHDLFITPDKQPRTYNIPIAKLSHVMRNTENIMKFTNETREEYVGGYVDAALYTLPSPSIGHKVASRMPVGHRMKEGTHKKYILPFLVSRLREVLESITKPPFSTPLSNVAILYDNEEEFQKHKCGIWSFLAAEFNTTPQTIEEQLVSNNTNDIIVDNMKHVMSFEAPVVVFISTRTNSCLYFYKIATRARVSLTLLDVSRDGVSTSFIYRNMDVVLWEEDEEDETLIKYSCTCNMRRSCSC